MPADPSTAGSQSAGAKSPKRRPLIPGWGVLITLIACSLLIAGSRLFQIEVQNVMGMFDQAFMNLLTLILGFISVCTLFCWFVWTSGYPLVIRRFAFYGTLAILLVAIICLQVEEVTGNMVPHFAWRWSPRADQRLAKLEQPQAENVDLKTTTPDDFPQFLGPDRTNYISQPQLSGNWESTPPRELWRRKIGAGWCAFAVVNGFAVTMEQRGADEWVTCYEVATGKPRWGHRIPALHVNTLGGTGPRATPTIADGKVYAIGATGVLRCLDGATGELLWQDDLHARYGMTQVQAEAFLLWGRANSPLVTDGLVIIPAGGPQPKVYPGAEDQSKAKTLIAYDQVTGEKKWEGGKRQISYASPEVATLDGVRQIVIVNEDTVTGNDLKTGKELWSFPWPGTSNADASSSQAHALPENRLLLSKGYGGGAEIIEVKQAGGKWVVESVQKNPRVLKTKFTNVTIIGDFIYGLSDGILECVERDTLEPRWKSRQAHFGHGQVLGVGDKLLVLGEEGELALVAASPEGYQRLGQIQALEGKTWNNLCLTGKRLLVRNGQEAACYELP